MMIQTAKYKQIWIRILCVFALVLLSFAHKPVDISAPLLQMTANNGTAADPVFIRYETMPDGSIVSICVSENSAASDQHHKSHNMMADCEACRISAGFALVAPQQQAARLSPKTPATVSDASPMFCPAPTITPHPRPLRRHLSLHENMPGLLTTRS